MQTPQPLLDLVDDGVVEQIVRPLKSGKEASVFVVVAEGRYCAAKVYKDAARRNFRQRQDYVEGRRVGDSRQERAITEQRMRHPGHEKDGCQSVKVQYRTGTYCRNIRCRAARTSEFP